MIDVNYIADVLYGGVDFSLPGNGGKECAAFLSSKQRLVETVVYELFTCFVLWKMLDKVSIPEKLPAYREGTGAGKRLLLVAHSLIFAIEIGFKFATKQVIFLLNPCHVLTAIQVRLDCNCLLSLSLCYHPFIKEKKNRQRSLERLRSGVTHEMCTLHLFNPNESENILAWKFV